MRQSFQEMFMFHTHSVHPEYLLSTNQLEAVKEVAHTFWNLRNSSVDRYDFSSKGADRVRFRIENTNGTTTELILNRDNRGPLSWDNKKFDDWASNSRRLTLFFEAKSFHFAKWRVCRTWMFQYELTALFGRPNLGQTLSVSGRRCRFHPVMYYDPNWSLSPTAWFSVLLIACSSVSLYAGAHRIYQTYENWQHAKRNRRGSWSKSPQILHYDLELSWLFWRFMSCSKWNLILNNLAVICYGYKSYFSAVNHIENDVYSRCVECVVAFWTSLLLLFSVDVVGGEWSAFLDTLRVGLSPLLRLLFVALFVFLGFVLLGVASCGRPGGLFETADDSSVALFGFMNGDNVLATFQDIGWNSFWTSLFLFCFGILFLNIIVNIIMVVMEVSFFEAVPCIHEHEEEESTFLQGWSKLKDEKITRSAYGSCSLLTGSPKQEKRPSKCLGRVIVTDETIVRLIRGHARNIRLRTNKCIRDQLAQVCQGNLEKKGFTMVERVAAHHQAELRDILIKLGWMLNVNIDDVIMSDLSSIPDASSIRTQRSGIANKTSEFNVLR